MYQVLKQVLAIQEYNWKILLHLEGAFWNCKDWRHNCSNVNATVEEIVLKRE